MACTGRDLNSMQTNRKLWQLDEYRFAGIDV
jgi:hypothetical protein